LAVATQSSATRLAAHISALADPDWKTRWQACQTLGELGERRAAQSLIRALDDRNQWVRIVAAEALGHIGAQEATQALIFALNDDSIWVRRASVVALGQIGDEEAIPPLMNRLLDPPSSEWPEELRDTIAHAMHAIGEPAFQVLIHALDDTEPWVSCAAARALGQIGDPQAIAPLAELTKQKHSMVRSFATQALAKIADVRAVRAALNTDEAPRAFWKLMALKEIDETTTSQLQSLLDDPDPQVRQQAAEVLSHLGEEHSAESLAASLGAESRFAATGGPIDDEPAQPSSEPARSAFTFASGEEPCDSVGPLVESLGDPAAEVRLAAAEALGRIGAAGVIPDLIAALQDGDSRVRAAAARSMGEIGARDPH
jgi:HEAT repeat protein